MNEYHITVRRMLYRSRQDRAYIGSNDKKACSTYFGDIIQHHVKRIPVL